MPVYDHQVKQALQDIPALEIQALKAEIRRLDEKVDALRMEMLTQTERLDEQIESLRNELLAEIKRVDGKVDNVKNELLAEIRRVDATMEGLGREVRTALEIRERLAALEAKVGITRP